MKIIIAFIILAGVSASAQTVTGYTLETNSPSVKMTVDRNSDLLLNQKPISVHFSGRDFLVSNSIVQLQNPNLKTQIESNSTAIASNQESFTNSCRSGSIFVASSATSTNIIFSTPFPTSVDTNYSISFGSGSSFATFPNPEWSNKTTNGFTLNVSSVVGGGWQDWTATAYR